MIKPHRPRLSAQQVKALDFIRANERRILVVGDLHCPFELDGYFEFCLQQYDNFNCNHVVFIGDILDNHYSSYHETDPNALAVLMSCTKP